MTAVMYQVTGLMCSFVYGMGLQPTGWWRTSYFISPHATRKPAAHNNRCGPLP